MYTMIAIKLLKDAIIIFTHHSIRGINMGATIRKRPIPSTVYFSRSFRGDHLVDKPIIHLLFQFDKRFICVRVLTKLIIRFVLRTNIKTRFIVITVGTMFMRHIGHVYRSDVAPYTINS